MAIDYWQLVKTFAPGDTVTRILPGQGVTPYVGRVQNVLRGIGFLDIQWPFGAERVSPEEVMKTDAQYGSFCPPALDFSYFPGLDVKKANRATPWRHAEQLPAGFHKELARCFHRGASEMQSYDELWHRYASLTEDDAIRDEIGKFYLFANNAFELLLQQHARKAAAYWASRDRKYRASRSEIQAGCPNCPRCAKRGEMTAMRRTTYKMSEGQRARLFACPKDLYLIKQTDILGPDGEPVTW